MNSSSRNTTQWHRWRSGALVLAVIASVLVAGVGPVAAQDRQTEPAVVVDLDENGAADVTVVLTFDLTEDADREAFETLRTDEEALADLEDRFAARMDAVASATAERVDRDVTVRDASASLDTVDGGETGVVSLSVTVENLAAVDDGRLVLTEPFASGFAADRPVVIHPPDGYELASANPSPTERDAGALTWSADTAFDGFELVLESDGGATETATPGLGILAVAAALLGVTALARWRRH